MSQRTISVFNPMQNATKTTTAYLLANAFSNHGSTCLIDADSVNNQKRSSHYYNMRSRLPKPFMCHTAASWDQLTEVEKNGFDYVIVDTQKNPANGLVEAVGFNSDLIIIPSPPTAGAWTDGAKPAVDMIRGKNQSAQIAFLIANLQSIGTDKFESRAEGASVPIIGETPELDIDECIGNGWLPQYANAGQRRWLAIDNHFNSLATTILSGAL